MLALLTNLAQQLASSGLVQYLADTTWTWGS
jgi:hypothetical protein